MIKYCIVHVIFKYYNRNVMIIHVYLEIYNFLFCDNLHIIISGFGNASMVYSNLMIKTLND